MNSLLWPGRLSKYLHICFPAVPEALVVCELKHNFAYTYSVIIFHCGLS